MDAILLNGIKPEDLKEEILQGVKDYLQEVLSEKTEKETSGLLTRQETANFFSIDLSTLHNWTNQGKLQSYGIGNRKYYKLSEIEGALIKL
ncbi:helix-turn-helix domain-containing protein [Gramella jeungdoensis]|uniref:Helix-turn-helix domain-containing protein n=1 Tax=Gramella jeungdoensis TaxID=708091 RepID=A0ABT0YZZ1_9FLAO|nr:helix-turn-helix domain-containing protein [Gramella jeungdoensis]MCM8568899.1 helix-turn-helix domain-containing protein [Gramella jeungdoensis]